MANKTATKGVSNLKVNILSLFPKIFETYLSESLIAKAQKKNIVKIKVHNIRDWTNDPHRTADDRPYGGGPGMVMKVEPIVRALKEIKSKNSHVILLSPRGTKLTQRRVVELSRLRNIIVICGHYEGVDGRIADYYSDEEISVGDYILSGGESAAMVLVDAITRLVPGFLGNRESLTDETFNDRLLEFPQYTRPEVFEGHKVPGILLGGNHQKIEQWRKTKSQEITKERRSDLLT